MNTNDLQPRSVSLRLAVAGASVELSGPQEWVDQHLDRFLSTPAFSLEVSNPQQKTDGASERGLSTHASGRFPPHFERWMTRHGIGEVQVDQVLHRDGDKAIVIAPMLPGVGRHRVTAAYLLEGLAALLTSETSRFQDKAARDLLGKHNAYDPANHAGYFKEGLKGKLVGDKESGFMLSIPGQIEAARVVKQIVGDHKE